MNTKKGNRLKVVLFILFFYILAQLAWWAFLISRLTSNVYAADVRLDQRIAMVWGEGIVFASILLAGFIFTYRSYQRELNLAKQQRNFLMSVTHEFKTPIASLSLYLQTIQSRKLTDEKLQELVQRALQDTVRLNALAENMLLATRIDQNAYPMNKSKADFSAFVKSTIDSLSGLLNTNQALKINVQDAIIIDFDPFMMQSVITNLFENAIKYSPVESEIEVLLKLTKSGAELRIADQGIGIAAADQQKIFEKFVRLGNEETRTTKGTGLGLYIANYFIQQHNGSILVENNSPNGTVFIVTLPI